MPANDKTFKVIVNGFVFFFTQADLEAANVVTISSHQFNCIKDYRSVNAKLIETDATCKNQVIEVEGERFSIAIQDELDQLMDQMGLGVTTGKQVKEIKAPMPGLVLEVSVTDGQLIKAGDKIAILEAMKMENSILAHSDATIKKVAVKAGQAVEKGQVLVELE